MAATVIPSDEAPVSAAARTLYVYGVVPADVTFDPAGAPAVEEGAAVQVVRGGSVAALVSPVSSSLFAAAGGDDLAWLEAPVRAHEAVLERALGAGPVVPMRFGTVVAGEEGVRAYLDEHRSRLAAALEDLEGKREWGVKAWAGDDALTARVAATEQDAPARAEGAAYLARKRAEREAAQALAAELDTLAADVHARLSAGADRAALVSATLPSGDRRRTILNAAYLVRVADEPRFHAAADELRGELAGGGVELAVTGPWPPYSFVGDDL